MQYLFYALFPVAIALGILTVVSIGVMLAAVVASLLPGPKVPFTYNLRNLQVRWVTTVVTALAFTLVVWLLCVMLAFVGGMDRVATNSGTPGNVIIYSDGATEEVMSKLPPGSVDLLPSEVQKLVKRSEDNKFMATQEVSVFVTHELPNPEAGGRRIRYVQMRGLDDVRLAAKVHELELAEGDWFSPSGVREVTIQEQGTSRKDTAPEVVLGLGIARIFGADLGKDTLKPGELVKIGPRTWYITGIMKSEGTNYNSEIWALDSAVQETFGRPNSYTSYVVRTFNEDLGLKAVKLLKDIGTQQYAAQTEKQLFEKLSKNNDQFRFAINFVAVVMAIGGVMGVMNTMFAAINQRAKDIGVMRLLGFSRWQILSSFLVESLIIGLLGGALGCLLSLPFDGMSVTSVLSSGGPGGGKSVVFKMVVDAKVMMMGMTLATLMAAVGGLVPAFSAMRLRPLESLR